MASILWVGLVLQRTLPVWLLWVLAPILVLPMALGSAAVFVALLPAALLALFIRSALSPHSRVTMGALLGGVLLLAVAMWAGGSLALAPGLTGSQQGSATSIFSERYLKGYLATTGKPGPTSRLGFMRLAVDTNLQGGPAGILLGQGPSTAVIGPRGIQVGPGRSTILAPASVQSVQRLILGFGFPVLLIYVLTVVVGVVWVQRRSALAADGMASALVLALPVAAGTYLVAGVYAAGWTDPGVAATFWCLLAASVLGVSSGADTRVQAGDHADPDQVLVDVEGDGVLALSVEGTADRP
jgi:hypothetical protein